MTVSSIALANPHPEWGKAVLSWTDLEAAGAVHSLQWPVGCAWKAAREILNHTDDGRLMQWAVNFGQVDEACNPTEGGSETNAGFLQPSESKLLQVTTPAPNVLCTTSRMSFWKKQADGRVLSDVILSKQVTLGYAGIWNAIEVRARFSLPQVTLPGPATFEFTSYMQPEFSRFETLDVATRALSPVDDGPGEQPLPLVFSTPDGEYALGVWAPDGLSGGGYGRWRPLGCTKWNAVDRVAAPASGGIYDFRRIGTFGTRADARDTICHLAGF